MIVINGKVLAIVPITDPISMFMRSFVSNHVEVVTLDVMRAADQPTLGLQAMSLWLAEDTYGGTAEWVCPD